MYIFSMEFCKFYKVRIIILILKRYVVKLYYLLFNGGVDIGYFYNFVLFIFNY